MQTKALRLSLPLQLDLFMTDLDGFVGSISGQQVLVQNLAWRAGLRLCYENIRLDQAPLRTTRPLVRQQSRSNKAVFLVHFAHFVPAR